MRTKEMPRPVLKWAGGKAQLAALILERLPPQIDTYREPFFGGGAVFFALARQNRFSRAVLSDVNPELIDVYRAIVEDVDAVIRRLKKMTCSEEDFYRVRAQKPTSLAGRAARTIYLNKTGYNGLYRVNRSGDFNVPYGRYESPRICDEPNLRQVASVLSKAEFHVEDFEAASQRVQSGDAVYFDPPYLPVSKTSDFTSYARHPFLLPEHERLAKVFDALSARGIPAVLSNSCTPDTKRLYLAHRIEYPLVARAINSDSTKRGKIKEILVSNSPALRLRKGH
jgi:DNA adenine methylase